MRLSDHGDNARARVYTRPMLIDEALRATFRNFSTLFLLVAVVTVPIHIAHAYVFRGVIAVSDLHPEIERFPEGRQVRRVGPEQLRAARRSFVVVSLLELAVVVVLLRAARRVLTAADPRVVTVADAYRALPRAAPRAPGARWLPWALAAAAFGALVALLLRAAGMLLIQPLPDERAFAWVGLLEGTVRAVGAAFFLGIVAHVTTAKDT